MRARALSQRRAPGLHDFQQGRRRRLDAAHPLRSPEWRASVRRVGPRGRGRLRRRRVLRRDGRAGGDLLRGGPSSHLSEIRPGRTRPGAASQEAAGGRDLAGLVDRG